MNKPLYQVDKPLHVEHRRRYYRRRRGLLITLLLVILLAAVFGYDLIGHPPSQKIVGKTVQTHIAGPQTFKATYFEFSDTSKWVFAPNDSGPKEFTYLLYVSGLPAHSVTVYVNQTPLQSDLATTYVLPVQLKGGNAFSVGAIAGPCGALYKPTDLKRIKPVALGATTMLCVPDSPQYSAEVGQVGGNYNLALKRTNGQIANYIIIYRNLTVAPDPTPFTHIMQTFQAL